MPGWFHKSGSPNDSPEGEDEDEGSAPESARAFREGLEDHLKARAELLALEVREASEVVAQKGVLGLLIAGLLFFCYALLLTASVSLLGRWVETWAEGFGWQLVALATGIAHFLAALKLFNKLKGKPDRLLFEYTRAEFHKDRAWLKKNKTSGKKSDNSP